MSSSSEDGREQIRPVIWSILRRGVALLLSYLISGGVELVSASEFKFDLSGRPVPEFSVLQYRLTPPVMVPGYEPKISSFSLVGRIQHGLMSAGVRYQEPVSFWEHPFVYKNNHYPNVPSGELPHAGSQWEMVGSQWTVKHGLPSNKVVSLCRTRDGFLWVGTENGLARFDGRSFLTYDRENTPLMRRFGSRVEALFDDGDGTLWIGLDSGVIRYINGSFTPLPEKDSLHGIRVKGFTARGKGGVWIATREGVYVWEGHTLSEFEIEEITARIAAQVILENRSTLWIGSQNGLIEYDIESEALVSQHFIPGQDVVFRKPSIRVMQVDIDRDDGVWVGTSDLGLWHRSASGTDFEQIECVPEWSQGNLWPQITRFDLDDDGNVWMVDGSLSVGLSVLPDGEAQIRPPVLGGTIGQGFAVMCDQEGAIWIGSREGLFQFKRLPFSTFWYDGAGQSNSFSMGNRCLFEGADGELVSIRSESFLVWSGMTLILPSLRTDVGLSHTGFFDEAGNLWVGHGWGGITQVMAHGAKSPLKNHVEPKLGELGVISSNCSRAEGGRWFGNAEGVYQSRAPYDSAGIVVEDIGWVSTLCEDTSGRLWIGTREKGLFSWKDGDLRAFGKSAGLPATDIHALFWHGDALWIGTGQGICRFHEGHIQDLGVVSDMPKRPIGGIIVDRFGALWMSHDGGLSRVDVGELDDYLITPSEASRPAIAHYDSEDGMLSVQNVTFADRICLEGRDGRLWFGKASNLVSVDPERFVHAAPAPSVSIDKIRANNVTLKGVREVTVPAEGRRLVEVHFTCPSLYASDRLMIEYKLDGIDADWRRANLAGKAVYPLLPTGRFTFRARARNHEGRWSKQDTVLSVIALPRYWETIGFRASLAMSSLVLLLSIGFWRFRIMKRRLEQRSGDRIMAERERIAREIHDSLGSVIGQANKAKLEAHELERLVTETVEDLRDLVWSINPRDESLEGLVKFVAGYSSRFTESVGLSLDLELPDVGSRTKLDPTVRIHLVGILKEALTNVARHADAERVWVRLELDGQNLELSIADDGRGVNQMKNTSGRSHRSMEGIGLSNMMARADDVGGCFNAETRSGGGTVIRISIPSRRLQIFTALSE